MCIDHGISMVLKGYRGEGRGGVLGPDILPGEGSDQVNDWRMDDGG